MNAEEKQKQIRQLRHTLAESRLAIDVLRKVIVEVESQLQKINAPENFEPHHKGEKIAEDVLV